MPESDKATGKIFAEDEPLVLIVEDDSTMRDSLNQLMIFLGCRTVQASNGKEAVDKALQTVPDLILLDIRMPVMDGITAMQILRSQPITEHIPIIIVSAMGATEDIIHGLKEGADDYISKPYNYEDLLVRVEVRLRANYRRFSRQLNSDKNLNPIFISYKSLDWDEYVKPLVMRLEAERLPVWVDRTSIEGSNDWLDEINKALKSVKRMIVCLSPDAIESRYVKMEYRYAFNNGIRLYPLVCRDVDLPAELQTIHYYSYSELDALVAALKR